MTNDGTLSDPERLAGYEPGTIFLDDAGLRVLVVWGGLAVVSDNPRPCMYADADNGLTIEAVPVRVSGVRSLDLGLDSVGRDANLALVKSLPPGSAFVETDGDGREHWFMKTFHGVMLDNGTYAVTTFDGGYDDRSGLLVIFVPRGESETARSAFNRLIRA